MKLRPYQETGRDFLRARRYAMLADAPGVGKTAQAIMAIEPYWRVLIVCPASVKNQWRQAIWDWARISSIVIDSSRDVGIRNEGTTIVNYDLIIRPTVKAALLKAAWHLIIFDEAHKLKSMSAKRTKAALGKDGLRSRATRIWFLTGTPIKNRTVDLYPILRSCAPNVLGPYQSFLKFAYRYCGAYIGQFGLSTDGASNTEELRERLKPFMLRREKREVLTELPPRVISKVDLECTPAAKKLIEQEQQKTIEQAGEDDPSLFKLGEIARIRQVLAKHKVPVSVDYIKDLLEEEEKIVVFYYHKEVLVELRRALQMVPSVFIDGSVPPNRRAGVVEDFRSRKDVRIFFGQMEACGEGIDGLQTASSCCVFVEPSWSHTDIEQCIGRLERSGQRSDVNVHILVIKDTLESRMMDVVKMKLNVDEKLYNTKEKEMAKAPITTKTVKKIQEERNQNANVPVQLIDVLNRCVAALEAIVEQLEQRNNPQVSMTIEPPQFTPPKDSTSTDRSPAPTAVMVGEAEEIEISEEVLKARAADICNLTPDGTGKTKVVALIKKIGGGKLADIKTPALRKKAMAEFDKLFVELSDGDNV